MQAGLIGLGAMGEGMATNLAKAGLLQTVFNRTSTKAEIFVQQFNVERSATITALVSRCNLIFLCVSADQDVLDIIEHISQSIKPGSIVVDMSTVSVETARQAAQKLAEKQVEFIDAPVSGGVEGAKKGTLVMMAGGKAEVLEKIAPWLDAMTQRVVHMGDVGSGQATKAVNQIMAAGINQAVTEALSFGQRQELAMEKVIDVIAGGAAGNWFLQHRGPTMINGEFTPGFKLALHHKDLKICQKMAEQSGMDLSLVKKTLMDYQKLMEQGYGEEDISALYRLRNR
jgi:3-hydroxyisobutyrate dehydrogenase